MTLRPGVAALLLLAAVACDDRQGVVGTGSMSIVVTSVDGQPVAAPPAEHAGIAAFDAMVQDSGKVTVTGPTTRTVLLTRTTTFSGTVTDLAVGSYAVVVYTYLANAVSYVGTTTNVAVTSGQTATATISNFATFAPTLPAIAPSTTDAFRITVPFTGVGTAATGYRVETASNAGFTTNLSSVDVTASPGTATAAATGTWFVRVKALNATGAPAGGTPSAVQTFTVVTDRRASADDGTSAPNLGFFANNAVTLDSLNVWPVADADWFSLSQCNGDSLTVSALALRLSPPSPLNSALHVYNASGLLVAQNADSGGSNTDGFVRMAHAADQSYKVRVSGNGTTAGHYRVQIQGKGGANNLTSSCRVTPMATTSITAGYNHSCSVRAGNIVDCWGYNAFGQLGNGTSTSTSSPTRVSGTTQLTSVSAGAYHTCAISTTFAAHCWGANFYGQVGDGTMTERPTPVAVPTLTFSVVAAGDLHTCAISGSTQNGVIYCWGLNNTGQLGNGGTSNSNAPTAISGGLGYVTVSAGAQHTCALTNTNQIYCWGSNNYGQIGDASTIQRNLPTLIPPPGGLTWGTVRAGGFHTCAYTTTGVGYCWGRNAWGQLGTGATTQSTIPIAVSGGLTFSAIAPGRFATCGISGSGTFCWGSNFSGQLGDNSQTDRAGPTLVSGALIFQAVTHGGSHTCAAQSATGNAFCWGSSHFGQTGDGQPFNHLGPVPTSGPALALKSVTTGNQHTCGATTGNVAFCWGWNGLTQLGDGSSIERLQPQPVSGGLSFQSVVAGVEHSCGLTTVNVVYCWGGNSYGQFGNAGFTSSSTPTAAASGQTFTQISAGDFHTCGRNAAGSVLCWGYNFNGQVGNNSTSNAPSPVAVAGANYTTVSAGANHTCAVNTTNQAFCWGDNSGGGIGDNSTQQRLVPTQVSGGLSFASVSAGGNFSCGRTTANAAYCWGLGGSGQLGNNLTNNFSTPQLVSGGHTWASLSTNRNATACGLTAAGVAYCWGGNLDGQLGDGTFLNRTVPTPVFTALTFAAIASGDLHTCAYVTAGTPYCWGNNEHGALGNNTRTTRIVPNQVLTGPATAPPGFAGAPASVGDQAERVLDADPSNGKGPRNKATR